MNKLTELREKYKANSARKQLAKYKKESLTRFQVEEKNGMLWLTYLGYLVCPCDMLKDDPLESISRMRELYIENNTTHTT